jgi:hypothetical protein
MAFGIDRSLQYGIIPHTRLEETYTDPNMDDISKNDAMKLVSKWERQNQAIFVICASSWFALSASSGQLSMCLDDLLALSLADGTQLKLFISDAAFSQVGPDDFPAESLLAFPRFERGVSISFPGHEMGCYLLACASPTAKVEV